MAGLEEAREAKAKLAAALDGRAEVNGIGIAQAGDGYELRVNLRAPAPVPEEIDGVPVRSAVVGDVTRR